MRTPIERRVQGAGLGGSQGQVLWAPPTGSHLLAPPSAAEEGGEDANWTNGLGAAGGV